MRVYKLSPSGNSKEAELKHTNKPRASSHKTVTRRRWDVAAAHSAAGDERTAELDHNASGRPPLLTSEHIETSPLLSLRETGSADASSLLLAVSAGGRCLWP